MVPVRSAGIPVESVVPGGLAVAWAAQEKCELILIGIDHEEHRFDLARGGEAHVALRAHREEGDGLLAGQGAIGNLDYLGLRGSVRGKRWIIPAADVGPRVKLSACGLLERRGV